MNMGVVVTDYVSDHTTWMREQMAKHPEWEADQQAGRALWWDKRLEPSEQEGFAEAKVAQKSYPYDVHFFGE
jgi:hypothetical protein